MDRGGFDTPPSVIDATLGYRDTSDPIRRFVEEMIEITGGYDDRVTRRSMFSTYKAWCDEENYRPVGAQKFWGRIRNIDERIDVDVKIAGTRYLRGIQLKTDV